MNNTRKHSIIQAFQGEWICTQNIYFFNTKNLYHKKEKIEINTINNKQKHDYYSVRCLDNIEADNSSLIISPTILSKNFNNLNNTYELVTFDQKYITFKTLANKANYYEYLYTINNGNQ